MFRWLIRDKITQTDRVITPNRSLTTIFPWLVLLLSAGFTIIGWRYALHNADEKEWENFDSLVTRTTETLERNLFVTEDLLIGAAAFFNRNEHMNSKEWKNYVASLMLPVRHPGFLGIGYAEFIPNSELQTIQTSKPWPAERRNDYIITRFFEPTHPKWQMIDYDIGSDTIKREAAESARDSGRATLSRKSLLFAGDSELFGAYLYIPIYKRGMPVKTLGNRRTALQGWVFMPLSIGQILNAMRTPKDSDQLDFDVFDGQEILPAMAFSHETKTNDAQRTQMARWSKIVHLTPFSANWAIRATSLPALQSVRTNNDPTRILWGSSLLSLLLWALIVSLLYTRHRALDLAVNTSRDLVKTKNSAISASRVKSEFLANMSHEIRTPLFAMSGMLDLLLDSPIAAEQRHYARTCKQSVETLTSLINDILDLSKVEAGKMDIETIPFDLHSLLNNISSGAKAVAVRKGLRCSLVIHPDLPVWLEGDPTRLQQVLSNLLSNAVKFTATGEIIIRAGVENANDHIVRVKIEVIDTGIGLSNDAIAVLFKPFAQADVTVSREYGGAGLGLFISNGLVTLMRGTIGVQSQVGCGSTFWFSLPLNRSCDLAIDAGTASVCHPSAVLHTKRLLVVEDNLINQEVTTKIIEKMGHHADCVDDGDQVLGRLEMDKYNLVIMDCRMHRMNGYEAAKMIRSHVDTKIQAIPIIAMTASAISGEREKCLQVGMDDYISKPINRALFENMVSKWLGEYEKHLARIASNTLLAPSMAIDQAALDNLRNLDRPGEEPVVKKCFELFLKTTPTCLSGMQKALSIHDLAQISHIAHSLKTSSATLGAHRMANICLQIEELPGDVVTDAHQRLLDQLTLEFGLAKEELHIILADQKV